MMDYEYFMHLADTFRSPHIWKYEEGEWKLRRLECGNKEGKEWPVSVSLPVSTSRDQI